MGCPNCQTEPELIVAHDEGGRVLIGHANLLDADGVSQVVTLRIDPNCDDFVVLDAGRAIAVAARLLHHAALVGQQ